MDYVYPKLAGEVEDYSIDWSNEILTGETISSSEWETEGSPPGITIDSDEIDTTNSVTTVYLSGGTAGEEYILTNTVVTDGLGSPPNQRTYKKSIIVPVTT